MNPPRPDRCSPGFSSLRILLATAATIAGAFPAPDSMAGQAGALMAYVGTFSSPLRDMLPTQVDLPPGNGRGIHLFKVDRSTGALTPAGVHEMGISPSCLAVSADGRHLYTANETDRRGDSREGSVSAFLIDPADGHLTPVNTVRSGGAGPTYLSLHPSGRWLFVANYFGGSVAVLPVRGDGGLGDPSEVQVDAGTVGPIRPKNGPPGSFAFSGHDHTHAHMILPDPSGRRVLHADLGLDRLVVWAFDERSGQLAPNTPSSVAFPPGDGPRHFHFHPNGRWVYSIQEEASTVSVLDYDAPTGGLTIRQSLSSLPPGYGGSSFASELLVSRDGRFVYAGNRLHDSVAVFAVGRGGELEYVGEEATRGNYPRSFNFDPTGRWLYVCNQRADNLTQFEVNRRTGRLTFTGRYTPVGNPSIIVFVDLARSGSR